MDRYRDSFESELPSLVHQRTLPIPRALLHSLQSGDSFLHNNNNNNGITPVNDSPYPSSCSSLSSSPFPFSSPSPLPLFGRSPSPLGAHAMSLPQHKHFSSSFHAPPTRRSVASPDYRDYETDLHEQHTGGYMDKAEMMRYMPNTTAPASGVSFSASAPPRSSTYLNRAVDDAFSSADSYSPSLSQAQLRHSLAAAQKPSPNNYASVAIPQVPTVSLLSDKSFKQEPASARSSPAPFSSQTAMKSSQMSMSMPTAGQPAYHNSNNNNSINNNSNKSSVQQAQQVQDDSQRLKQHRPYTCHHEDCGKSFLHASSLSRHVMQVHLKQDRFVCPFENCRLSFKRQSKLDYHLELHVGDRPHACTFEGCDKRFNSIPVLRCHMRTHTGERPFKCQVESCGKQFSQRAHLIKHRRRIHSKYP